MNWFDIWDFGRFVLSREFLGVIGAMGGDCASDAPRELPWGSWNTSSSSSEKRFGLNVGSGPEIVYCTDFKAKEIVKNYRRATEFQRLRQSKIGVTSHLLVHHLLTRSSPKSSVSAVDARETFYTLLGPSWLERNQSTHEFWTLFPKCLMSPPPTVRAKRIERISWI